MSFRASSDPEQLGTRHTHTLEGQPLYWLEAGAGPPMVFLHNGGGSLENWFYQVRHFSSAYRVYALDFPGFGHTGRARGPLTLEGYADTLGRWLAHLGLERPALVGNCIGASVVLEHALRRPQEVRALALFNLCGGAPWLGPRLRGWARFVQARPQVSRSLSSALAHLKVPLLGRYADGIMYGTRPPVLEPALREQFRALSRHAPALERLHPLLLGLASFEKFTRPCPLPPGFPPVLLGWGSHNAVVPLEHAFDLLEWLRVQTFWTVPGGGHMSMYEQPEAFNALLERFLDAQGAGTAADTARGSGRAP